MISFIHNQKGIVTDLNNPGYSKKHITFNNYSYGGLMHISSDDRVNYNRYDIESYLTENYNWAALADQIATLGFIDYIFFRVKVEDGFHFWPTQVQFNDGNSFSYNGATVPIYGFDYHIGNSYYTNLGITPDMVERFMTEFKRVGIVPGLYYPVGRDRSTRTDLSDSECKNSASSAIYGKYDEFHRQVIDELDELMRLYNPSMIWLDSLTKHPWLDNSGNDVRWQNHAEIYATIKNRNPNTIVIGNLNTGTDGHTLYSDGKLQFYPLDIITQEQQTQIPDGEYATLKSHEGRNILVPMETLWDGLYNDDNPTSPQYTWWDTNSVDSPTNANQIRTQQEYQDGYDAIKAKGATVNFNFAPIPASIGTNKHLIDSTIITRLQNLIL